MKPNEKHLLAGSFMQPYFFMFGKQVAVVGVHKGKTNWFQIHPRLAVAGVLDLS
mgnify:CR=1 FL=1